MTPRFCRYGHEVPEGQMFCALGDDVDESFEPTADRAEETPDQDGPAYPGQPSNCRECGAPAPDSTTVCLACGKSLTSPRLVLTFPAGQVTLSTGDQVQLGRCQELTHAHLCADFDNVSRRHATVGVDDANGTWIRDDESTNGTFINGREIKPSRVPRQLHDGDQVRLGADLIATVHVNGVGRGS